MPINVSNDPPRMRHSPKNQAIHIKIKIKRPTLKCGHFAARLLASFYHIWLETPIYLAKQALQWIGKSVAYLKQEHQHMVIAIKRNDEYLTAPNSHIKFEPDDILILLGPTS
ncbi:MAG: cation:proton antiporter regulatory subunit [Ardenticatenaceae bacterium]